MKTAWVYTVYAWKHETHDEAIKFLSEMIATAEGKVFSVSFVQSGGLLTSNKERRNNWEINYDESNNQLNYV